MSQAASERPKNNDRKLRHWVGKCNVGSQNVNILLGDLGPTDLAAFRWPPPIMAASQLPTEATSALSAVNGAAPIESRPTT